MPSEPKRGCGYRKVGSLYLCGGGLKRPCDMLPIELKACQMCGFEIPFTRNLMRLSKQWMCHEATLHHDSLKIRRKQCLCGERYSSCALCFPEKNDLETYGLMWVGQRHYTPQSFRLEADKMGVSKKIPDIPKWLTLGKTWVLLAHQKVPRIDLNHKGMLEKEPEYMHAIFSAFIAERIEMPIWKSQATAKYINDLEAKGITPVIIQDGDKVHAPSTHIRQFKLYEDGD